MAKVSATPKPPVVDAGWRLPDPLWTRLAAPLPPRPVHPLGSHRPWVDDCRAMDAICFVLRPGCQWHALSPTGICSSASAHRRFQEWVAAGVFHRCWQLGLIAYDGLKSLDWTWQARDGAMTKAPLGREKTGKNPTDRGKLGVKPSVLTEAAGVPVGLAVAGTNRNDFAMARATIESIPVERPEPTAEAPQGLCLDKGYDDREVRGLVEEFGYTAHIRARGEEAQTLTREAGFKARRGVVERTHRWMNRCRRTLIRWKKKPENDLALLHLACAWITYRAAGLLG